MKKAILVVSFGTSFDETREKNIGKLENIIKENYNDYTVIRAFTSQIVINILKKRNIIIQNVDEALKSLINQGFEEVVIQPTHIINGEEFDKMTEQAAKYKDEFSSFKIGTALVNSTEDLKYIVEVMAETYPLKEDEAVVFMGHGSKHYSNIVYPSFNYAFDNMGHKNFFVTTVEGYPTFDDSIADLDGKGFKHIFLLPLMLVAGDHATNDMAGDDETSFKSRLEKIGYKTTPIVKGLGEYKKIQELYIKHLEKLING